MVQILREESAKELGNYTLMEMIESKKVPSLIGYHNKPHRYTFKILPKTYQEISYYGRLRITSKVKQGLHFGISHQTYGSRFIRTKSEEVLFGSFTEGVACMDVFYHTD